MTSHFSFGEPEQSTSDTGIKFWRKSPAVGSTEMHCPFGARISTLENALVAVASRLFASAAADGWRVPPARDTGTGVVGLAVGIPPAPAFVVMLAEEDAAEVGALLDAAALLALVLAAGAVDCAAPFVLVALAVLAVLVLKRLADLVLLPD